MTDRIIHALSRQPVTRLVRPLAAFLLSLAIAFGGGLWLTTVHHAHGGITAGQPSFVTHWLRDATLALPVVMLAVWVGVLLTRRVLSRSAAEPSVAIVRVEQLYPFPRDGIEDVLAGYPKLREVAWVQEEPSNMGAWSFVAPLIADSLPKGIPLDYVGRTSRASPAVGAHHAYNAEQAALIDAAFGQIDPDLATHGIQVLKEVENGSRHPRPAPRRISGRGDRRAVAQTRG